MTNQNHMKSITSTCSFLVLFSFLAQAQKLPNTNVYLFNMIQKSDSVFQFEKPLFLTGFNSDGYNNQPAFVSNDEIYLTVQMADDTTQTDIYSLNLRTKTKTRITATPDSEYSPQVKPGSDDDSPMFSCVRVEKDGQQTQRLWEFPMDRSNNGKPAFEKVKGVGYYTWLNNKKAAVFITGEPHRLAMADTRRDKLENITANIGRALQRLPNGNLAFVHKYGTSSWLLKKLNAGTKRSELITATPKEKEDFIILGNGTFLLGNGSKLLKFNPKKDNTWIEIADFKYYGINNITRMAVRDGKIAIVSK